MQSKLNCIQLFMENSKKHYSKYSFSLFVQILTPTLLCILSHHHLWDPTPSCSRALNSGLLSRRSYFKCFYILLWRRPFPEVCMHAFISLLKTIDEHEEREDNKRCTQRHESTWCQSLPLDISHRLFFYHPRVLYPPLNLIPTPCPWLVSLSFILLLYLFFPFPVSASMDIFAFYFVLLYSDVLSCHRFDSLSWHPSIATIRCVRSLSFLLFLSWETLRRQRSEFFLHFFFILFLLLLFKNRKIELQSFKLKFQSGCHDLTGEKRKEGIYKMVVIEALESLFHSSLQLNCLVSTADRTRVTEGGINKGRRRQVWEWTSSFFVSRTLSFHIKFLLSVFLIYLLLIRLTCRRRMKLYSKREEE